MDFKDIAIDVNKKFSYLNKKINKIYKNNSFFDINQCLSLKHIINYFDSVNRTAFKQMLKNNTNDNHINIDDYPYNSIINVKDKIVKYNKKDYSWHCKSQGMITIFDNLTLFIEIPTVPFISNNIIERYYIYRCYTYFVNMIMLIDIIKLLSVYNINTEHIIKNDIIKDLLQNEKALKKCYDVLKDNNYFDVGKFFSFAAINDAYNSFYCFDGKTIIIRFNPLKKQLEAFLTSNNIESFTKYNSLKVYTNTNKELIMLSKHVYYKITNLFPKVIKSLIIIPSITQKVPVESERINVGYIDEQKADEILKTIINNNLSYKNCLRLKAMYFIKKMLHLKVNKQCDLIHSLFNDKIIYIYKEKNINFFYNFNLKKEIFPYRLFLTINPNAENVF